MPILHRLLLLAGTLLLTGTTPLNAQPAADTLAVTWEPVDSLNERLPGGVRVYAGQDDAPAIRAWYVRIDEDAADIETRVVVSDDTSGHETVSTFGTMPDACVAVNGGYFRVGARPAQAVGLVVRDDSILFPATRSTTRFGRPYETARAALGFTADERIEMTWATTRDDTLYRWPSPPRHRPGRPAPALCHEGALRWHVRDALSAGPMLLRDGRLRITADEEVFFGTAIPETHPRTAAGRTADGDLIVMVVDGRQPASRGVNLVELARLMRSAGAVDALNLDGGGSSALVVNGALINRPEGDTVQRPVLSALVTFCGERGR